MCYIDIHCHLDGCNEISQVVQRAREGDVRIIVSQGTNLETNREVLELSKKYPEVKAALGIYPIEALTLTDKEIEQEISFIESVKDKIVAIGEVGIDFKDDQKEHERQKRIFRQFVELAKKLDKPIIVHSRKAELECIEILEEMKAKKVIMHCFCGKRKLADRIIVNGWYLTIPTNVNRNEQFQYAAKTYPLNQLFCETDSPYLHPDKTKEGENEPANVVVSYEYLAKARGISLEEVKRALFDNYNLIFG